MPHCFRRCLVTLPPSGNDTSHRRSAYVVTSRFGTMSMWTGNRQLFARARIETISPYTLEQTRNICRALAVKRELRESKFWCFRITPAQVSSRRFSNASTGGKTMYTGQFARFGIRIVRRALRRWLPRQRPSPIPKLKPSGHVKDRLNLAVSERDRNSALKIYLQVRRELDADPAIRGSASTASTSQHFSDTTPCLAWNICMKNAA